MKNFVHNMKEHHIEDMPSGPLDFYRNQATFDWKAMKMIFEENKQCLNIKMNLWKTLSIDPVFSRSRQTPTTEEFKRIAAKRLHHYMNLNFFPSNISNLPYTERLRLMMAVNEAFGIAFPDVSMKHAIGVGLVRNALATMGTERHKHFLDALWSSKVVACFILTEVAHGSNTKQMKTTATFDKNTQEFVINTPDFLAAKCWSGNLGKTATLGIVFAQLIANDQNYGLHAFVVPLRDPKTLLPYPGLIIGDMGEKIGLHGIDNGFVIFKNFRIPKENLLNRTGDITHEGIYESSFSEPGKILGAVLENLSLGRLGIIQGSVNTLIKAVTIAVRYAAVRQQFSDNGNGYENAIIEYPLHQWRLFPYVAAASVFKIFINSFTNDYLNAVEKTSNSERLEEVNNLVSEIHSIVSAAKALITWTTRDAIQECREACGGHGYLKDSGLGDLRSDHDPTVTYEGDNNVLQQQSSNWLLKQWNNIISNKKTCSPLSSAEFFNNYIEIQCNQYGTKESLKNLKCITECYEWLITYLVDDISNEMEILDRQGHSRFAARNYVQVYRSRVMSRAYAELNVMRCFEKRIQFIQHDLRDVLNKLGVLYGLLNLEQHIAYFYLGGFCEGPSMTRDLKNGILDLCQELKPNILAMVDALAPPDFVINSILGYADGQLYKHLQESFFNFDQCLDRPDWWKEVIIEGAPDFTQRKSKL
ncbi:peroxisomal acyl-coenzyme A oxidase 3 isoform X2 [Coccinella septempunctata]|uniref:peroxisomal acyl-coenzyme A oxidase 3 isoform X2 n=1 Tax=Coccinella septempunctata TaxID=41139 RepID=UPI001D065FD4|nr:peroxisomal acyl-coenzyme A oxidase 3 isoform X2 [Coccinella septempunctata]